MANAREMRRQDRQLQDAEARELLQRGEYGILSIADAAGQPCGVPMSYAFMGDRIWLHSAAEGHKVDVLAENPQVSFCVVGNTKILPEKFSTVYESAIVHGTARLCEGAEKIAGLMHLVRKYSPEFSEKGRQYAEAAAAKTRVYCILIEHLTGKARKS